MDLCPKCRTVLYLKRLQELEHEILIIKTCRNPNCPHYQQDVSTEKIQKDKNNESLLSKRPTGF